MALSGFASASPLTRDAQDWVYLDNGQIRLGVKKTSGACVGYLSESQSSTNLLNHWDQGRFVQQSYYGRRDGTLWGDKPWRWNPVQGGDYKGAPATTLELKVESHSLYAKTGPRHWSGCVDIPEVVMEQWITLTGKVAHIRYRMTYSGDTHHESTHQEVPAVFVDPDLPTLVLYDGSKPWSGEAVSRSKPGWPNESRVMTENWAAYVDQTEYGIGAYVPIATNLTCYRFGRGSARTGACSYFAPIVSFAIVPGFVFEYDLYLAVGRVTEIRNAFSRLRKQGPQPARK